MRSSRASCPFLRSVGMSLRTCCKSKERIIVALTYTQCHCRHWRHSHSVRLLQSNQLGTQCTTIIKRSLVFLSCHLFSLPSAWRCSRVLLHEREWTLLPLFSGQRTARHLKEGKENSCAALNTPMHTQLAVVIGSSLCEVTVLKLCRQCYWAALGQKRVRHPFRAKDAEGRKSIVDA